MLDRFITIDQNTEIPLHTQVRQSLRRLINQEFQDGQKFFTEPALIKHLGLSQSTIRRALTDLTQEGLLIRYVAKGSFVNKGKKPPLSP